MFKDVNLFGFWDNVYKVAAFSGSLMLKKWVVRGE
jgi:hypothetical protein